MGSAAPARLALAGNGRTEHRAMLKRLVGELGLESRVVFLGYRSRPELWNWTLKRFKSRPQVELGDYPAYSLHDPD